MVSVVSRESYFETGLDVPAVLGYGGLNLAEVCTRLGVTTGSFYHYFAGWPPTPRTSSRIGCGDAPCRPWRPRAEADPRRRIATLIVVGLSLPHGAEAAIRACSSVDAHVHEVQVAVDQPRFDILYESASEILEDKRRAQVFASWGVYLLVGYEQASLPGDPGALEWIAHQWLGSLDSGVYTSVSGDD